MFDIFGVVTTLISQTLVLMTVLKSERWLYQAVAFIAIAEAIFAKTRHFGNYGESYFLLIIERS
jgi:hypothetical protein